MAIVHFVNYKKGTQSRAAMRGVMLYVMQAKKTEWEGQRLISGINCQPQSVYDDFLSTKLLYHKDSGVMFYHMVQSFPKGAAVDPRQVHEAARRLAEYFEGCEVLVCTHVDREHIHSHCIINSVNFETGKKLHMAKEQLQALMRRNDAICQGLGLPVFEAPTQNTCGMSGTEYHTALKGKSWKLRLMNVIDECMKYAADKDAFISLMESDGYAVRWESSRKYITYTTPEGMKCRDNKLHEEKYCKEVMEHEFRIRAEIIHGRAESPQPHRYGNAEKSAVQHRTAGRTDTTHRDPMSVAAGADKADTAGGRNKLGAGGNSEYAAGVENAHRPDTSAKISDRDTAVADTDEYNAGTGWEEEREVYLQMAELAAGLRFPHAGQMAGSADDGHRSGAGDGVRRGNSVEQYPKPVSLRPLQVGVSGLVAAGTLLDDEDGEDAEEKRRRIEAEMEAKNFGAAIGLIAGTAMVLKNQLDEQKQQEQDAQQTMGGL